MQPGSRIAFDYKPKTAPATASTHTRWFIIGLALPLLVGLLAYLFTTGPLRNEPALSVPVITPADLPSPQPLALPAPEPLGDTIEFVVRRNDTLDRIFRQLKLSLTDLATIREVPGVRTNLDQLRVGDTITLTHGSGLVHALSRRISETEVLSVTRTGDSFSVEFIATPVAMKIVTAQGTIDTSLFVAARTAGVSPDLIMRLANDIFGWKIDFALEIQRGDRFEVVYEQKYRDGKYIGDGRILAADFVNEGTLFRAVYYQSIDGELSGYFAPDGRSMRRQFLRAPLDFTRISSNFDPRRRHPILNSIRAHKGVDYAAPTGTIIKAAGDGRVGFVGTQGGYGRVVILEHGGGISTLYGHMSRFASGLRPGLRVQQSDTIGYVGSSGAATGPHLHYEYRLNGFHKNPRTVELPDAAPIPDRYITEFRASSSALLNELDRAHAPAMVATPVD